MSSRYKLFGLLCIYFLSYGFQSHSQDKSYPFEPGEVLKYSMHFGWFDVGNAEIWIDPELHYVEGEAHYSIQCSITSSSWVGFFKPINSCFESLVNVETLEPLVSRRDLKFGKDIDIRTDRFTYEDSVRIHAYVEDIDENRYHTFPQKDVPILDFLSTYLSIRNMNLARENKPVEVRTFYSNTLYEFQMTPLEVVDYNLKGRKLKAKEFRLQFPKNEMFKKGKHGKLIVSNDTKKIPLRMEVNIILGSFYFKLDEGK